MPKTTLSQFSFNRGELDPVLHGRSDWKYYYSGAEVLKNLITRPQGGAVKRGGLRLVAPALDDAGPSALVPFRFSVEQSYMLEFGHQRMRIIKDGGVVTYPAGHEREGEEVVVDTPYPAAALKDLRHAQTSDVMILTHADFAPRRLARYDHHDWRFSNLIASVRTATPTGLRITLSGGDDARYVVTAVSASGESPPTDAVVAEPSGRISYQIEGKSFTEMYYWLRERSVDHLPEKLRLEDRVAAQLFLQDAGYQSRDRGIYRDGGETVWMFSRPDGTPGEARWSLTFQPLIDEAVYACEMGWAGNVKPQLEAGIASYVQDYNSALPRTGVTGLAWSAVTGATGYRIYRESGSGADKLFRRIGEATATSFRDEKLQAGTTVLPDEEDPFTGQDRYPGVCAFFEQRLILGRTNKQPTTFWGSETGVYNSFAVSTPLKDSDSYEFTLSSGEMNAINWIVPLNDMLLGTSGGEWKAGGGGQAITPTNINARLQSWYGCSPR
ncbi:MAG: hypothetical protein LIP23_07850, partial [Planctomycetes bacterium]|nr:hypothetical protein [Planctomycetota bacterium]